MPKQTQMLFAYQNKDADCPHDFEITALEMAHKAIKKAKGEI